MTHTLFVKKKTGNRIYYESNWKNNYFDNFGARKAAYELNTSLILNNLRGSNTNIIKGGDVVPSYKKKYNGRKFRKKSSF